MKNNYTALFDQLKKPLRKVTSYILEMNVKNK